MRDGVNGQIPGWNIASWSRITRHVLVADDHDLLREAGDRRLKVLDPFHHDRPRSAALLRRLNQHMCVRVIPVHTRRLIRGKLQIVSERLAGIDQSLHHLIVMATRRSVGSVKVHINR